MKRIAFDSKREYVSPEIKIMGLNADSALLANIYSGGTPDGSSEEMLIDEEEDTSDGQPRAHKYSIWDYNVWY